MQSPSHFHYERAHQALDESLSDEDVLKAILRIMLKSKAWHDHLQHHKDAKLHIIATPGFHLADATKSITAIVASIQSPHLVAPPAHDQTPVQKYTAPYHSYHTQNVQPTAQGTFTYSTPSASAPQPANTAQQVIAGCTCGLVMDLGASRTTTHALDSTTSTIGLSYSLMNNSYVNTPAAQSYGTKTNTSHSNFYTN